MEKVSESCPIKGQSRVTMTRAVSRELMSPLVRNFRTTTHRPQTGSVMVGYFMGGGMGGIVKSYRRHLHEGSMKSVLPLKFWVQLEKPLVTSCGCLVFCVISLGCCDMLNGSAFGRFEHDGLDDFMSVTWMN